MTRASEKADFLRRRNSSSEVAIAAARIPPLLPGSDIHQVRERDHSCWKPPRGWALGSPSLVPLT